MQKRVRLWSIWLQAGILLSILAGAAFWIISAKETPSGRDTLKNDVAELRSQAAEGQLLAEQALANNVTSKYFRLQTAQMQKNAESVLKDLQSLKIKPELEKNRAQTEEFGTRLNADLKSLMDSYGNREETDRLKSDFADLFSQLIELENNLKESSESSESGESKNMNKF